ncbi:MAG: DinB family protein [Candidatus Rokubacteria bacterium]|nr:DinB family protein [Candidatus Rokubacteria bacterium]
MELTRFFFGCHAATHTGDVSDGRTPGADRWLAGLSDAQLRVRPGKGLNSIVWLLWHMARTEDVAVNLIVAARPQVFDEAWSRRMNIPHVQMGSGMTEEEVADPPSAQTWPASEPIARPSAGAPARSSRPCVRARGTRSSVSMTPGGPPTWARSDRMTCGSAVWAIPRGRDTRAVTSSAARPSDTTPGTSARP